MLRPFALLMAVVMVTACSDDVPEQAAVRTEIPAELDSVDLPEVEDAESASGTPMEDRVATIGLLNKRNNLSEDLELKPGEQQRVGDVIIRLRACERTAPWEFEKDEGAFVQMLVLERGSENSFRKVFSGWLFKNKPAINVVEHPIYDVWVKSCAMEFPGEE